MNKYGSEDRRKHPSDNRRDAVCKYRSEANTEESSNNRQQAVDYSTNKYSKFHENRVQNSKKSTEIPNNNNNAIPINRENKYKPNDNKANKFSNNHKVAMMDRHPDECYASEDDDMNEDVSGDDEEVAQNEEILIEQDVDADIELNIIRTQDIIRDVDEVTAEDSKRTISKIRPYATVLSVICA